MEGEDRQQNQKRSFAAKPNLPPGYRFAPTDYELIFHLQYKIRNRTSLMEEIKDVDLYKTDPKTLSEAYPPLGERVWYFFTSRYRKYPNGLRPDRSAGGGYWKATGADKPVDYKGETVGLKKTLVFYQGKYQEGVKTNWIMHEFRVDLSPRNRRVANDMKLEDWVLCRLYERVPRLKGNQEQAQEGNHSIDDSTPNSQVEGVINTQIQIIHNNEEDLATVPLVNHDNNGNVAALETPMDQDQELSALINYIDNTLIPPSLDDFLSNPDWSVPTNDNLSHTILEEQALMSLEQSGVFQEERSSWPAVRNHQIIYQQDELLFNHGTFHQQGVSSYHGNFHQQVPAYYMASNPDYNQLMPRKRRC